MSILTIYMRRHLYELASCSLKLECVFLSHNWPKIITNGSRSVKYSHLLILQSISNLKLLDLNHATSPPHYLQIQDLILEVNCHVWNSDLRGLLHAKELFCHCSKNGICNPWIIVKWKHEKRKNQLTVNISWNMAVMWCQAQVCFMWIRKASYLNLQKLILLQKISLLPTDACKVFSEVFLTYLTDSIILLNLMILCHLNRNKHRPPTKITFIS